MIYINENKYMNNEKNKQVGWVISESAPDPEIAAKTEITTGAGGKVQGKAIFQTINEKNRNGRFYEGKELLPQISSPRTLELLNAGGLPSEAGHPLTQDLTRQATIDPTNVCIYIKKLWSEGNDIVGTFKYSNLPIGKGMEADALEGVKHAFSARLLGSINNTSRGAEVTNIKLITYDTVVYPSHKSAYTQEIFTEATSFEETNSGILLAKKEMSKEEATITESGLVFPIVNQNVIDYIKTESANFKNITNTLEFMYDSIKLIGEGAQVQLSNKNDGEVIIVNLEQYIHNEIMDYVSKR